jgi:hypothetical protein
MRLIPKKTIEIIIKSGNHYLAALKGNQPTLYRTVTQQFIPHQTVCTVNKGHGRIEKRTVSICPFNCTQTGWDSIATLIRVESQRTTRNKQETETRYYISDLEESVTNFAGRIREDAVGEVASPTSAVRGYWGVENNEYLRSMLKYLLSMIW